MFNLYRSRCKITTIILYRKRYFNKNVLFSIEVAIFFGKRSFFIAESNSRFEKLHNFADNCKKQTNSIDNEKDHHLSIARSLHPHH